MSRKPKMTAADQLAVLEAAAKVLGKSQAGDLQAAMKEIRQHQQRQAKALRAKEKREAKQAVADLAKRLGKHIAERMPAGVTEADMLPKLDAFLASLIAVPVLTEPVPQSQ